MKTKHIAMVAFFLIMFPFGVLPNHGQTTTGKNTERFINHARTGTEQVA